MVQWEFLSVPLIPSRTRVTPRRGFDVSGLKYWQSTSKSEIAPQCLATSSFSAMATDTVTWKCVRFLKRGGCFAPTDLVQSHANLMARYLRFFVLRPTCALRAIPHGSSRVPGGNGGVRVTIGAPGGRCASRASKRMWRRRWSNEQEQQTQEMGSYPNI